MSKSFGIIFHRQKPRKKERKKKDNFREGSQTRRKMRFLTALTLPISSALIRTNSFLLCEPAISLPLVSIRLSHSLMRKTEPDQRTCSKREKRLPLLSPLSSLTFLSLSLSQQKNLKWERNQSLKTHSLFPFSSCFRPLP